MVMTKNQRLSSESPLKSASGWRGFQNGARVQLSRVT